MMISTTIKGYTQQFCAECADNTDLGLNLAKDLDHLEIVDQVYGEICDGCGRLIQEISVYKGLYLLKPELRLVLTAEIPAQSALEARLLLHESIHPEDLLQLVHQRLDYDLAEGELLSEEDQKTLTYQVCEPLLCPPPQSRWVTQPVTACVSVASPPATLSDLFELAPLQALLTRFEQSGLADRYMGSFEGCMILHHLLVQAQVKHSIMHGYLKLAQGMAHPHMWIDLSDSLGLGWLVDYHAQSQCGQAAPQGLFARKDYPHLLYYGAQLPLPLAPPQSMLQEIEEALRALVLA